MRLGPRAAHGEHDLDVLGDVDGRDVAVGAVRHLRHAAVEARVGDRLRDGDGVRPDELRGVAGGEGEVVGVEHALAVLAHAGGHAVLRHDVHVALALADARERVLAEDVPHLRRVAELASHPVVLELRADAARAVLAQLEVFGMALAEARDAVGLLAEEERVDGLGAALRLRVGGVDARVGTCAVEVAVARGEARRDGVGAFRQPDGRGGGNDRAEFAREVEAHAGMAVEEAVDAEERRVLELADPPLRDLPRGVLRGAVAAGDVGAVGSDFHAVGIAGERLGTETGRAAPRVRAEDDRVAAFGGRRDEGDRVAEHAREVVRHLRGGEARGGRGVRRHHHLRVCAGELRGRQQAARAACQKDRAEAKCVFHREVPFICSRRH